MKFKLYLLAVLILSISKVYIAGNDNVNINGYKQLDELLYHNKSEENYISGFISANYQSGEDPIEPISWIIPEDGGTPRNIQNIKTIRFNEFHIRASYEEGGSSPLSHPVSRMELICMNNSDRKVNIILHIDLSGDGTRTDYDNNPEAGMPWRDFVFIQLPGEEWHQVNGTSHGFITTVSFEVTPGMTKVGLSPWYSYNDLLNFINSLPQHPHLIKTLLGKSNGKREQWELTITDPSIDEKEKQIIFWHAREHGYETFSSFSMEGLINYLLSEPAAEFRKQYTFVLHPMTNVDGVADGYEYRGGYDYPDFMGTATAILTYKTIDRLKPSFIVTWHNWISPRDRNVIFYTDKENDRPSTRAWYRFIQLFPSLRFYDHRWRDEQNPIKYNWQGRSLSLKNVHQYAMSKYGTKVWGWEMSWWNFTVDDAIKSGSDFASAFLTTINEIQKGLSFNSTNQVKIELPLYKMHEFSFSARTKESNPFVSTTLVGQFTSPSGKKKIVDGFYDGQNIWRLRFVPDEVGAWDFFIYGEGVEVFQIGNLNCIPSQNHGFIQIDNKNPYCFSFSNGAPFFPMGETCYGLHDDSPISQKLKSEYIKIRRKQGFNYVRMSVGHSYEHAVKNHLFWAWGGTPELPHFESLNPDFFKSLDELLLQMRENDMKVELILLNFYRLPFTDQNQWTPSRERLWLRYIISRYCAFDNIFMWTISNEYETHPDGKYRLDKPDDLNWVRSTARFIKMNDPYKHLITVHPVISASTTGITPRDNFIIPWRIGEFFGDCQDIDVLSQQTGQTGQSVSFDNKLRCWRGDDPNLVSSIYMDRVFGKPVINSESGYEYLKRAPTYKDQVHCTDKVRRSAWRIVCAGGYFAAGFSGTLGMSDIWNTIDAPNHYTFILNDEGAASQMAYLYSFFVSVPYWNMKPFQEFKGNAVAMADEGNYYIFYLPYGGELTFSLTDLSNNTLMESKWYNPRDGRFKRSKTIKSVTDFQFKAPNKKDWILLIGQSL